jgi:hypothetical protein
MNKFKLNAKDARITNGWEEGNWEVQHPLYAVPFPGTSSKVRQDRPPFPPQTKSIDTMWVGVSKVYLKDPFCCILLTWKVGLILKENE